MLNGYKVRFHYVATLGLLGVVILLTLAFLLSALHRFQAVSVSHATSLFGQIVQQSEGELASMIETEARFTRAQQRASSAHLRGLLDFRPELMEPYLATIAQDQDAYGYYVGFADDAFFQVIAVRRQPAVVAALKAPVETWFALRSIGPATGERTEHWRFLDEARKPVGERTAATSYRPTQRPWYLAASKTDRQILTDSYVFQSSQAPGLTVASRLLDGGAVAGADISLTGLSDFLGRLPTASAKGLAVVLDQKDRVLASFPPVADKPLPDLAALTLPALQPLRSWRGEDGADRMQDVAGEPTVFVQHRMSPTPGTEYRVAALAPVSAFTGDIVRVRNQMLLIALVVLAVTVPLAWWVSRGAAKTLRRLAEDSDRIRHFDFSETPPVRSVFHEMAVLGEAHQVMRSSLKERTEALKVSQERLSNLVDNGLQLSSERDRQALLRHILMGGKAICHADAATLYLRTEHDTLYFAMRSMSDALPSMEIPLRNDDGTPNLRFVSTTVANEKRSVRVDDVYAETRFDLTGTKRFDAETGYHTASMLTVPLLTSDGEVLGVLQFLNAIDTDSGQVMPFPPEIVSYVEALAAQSAVALQNQNLLAAQQALMDGIIRIIAGAIDAKSAYTGGHCERVPELAIMLAREACEVQDGPLADFRFHSDDEWREFRIGAWLHDCGKVTTPEYVVDKATKLETIYNRIHEVRTRFEVLLRDARIEMLDSILSGGDRAEAEARLAERTAALRDDYAFVAESNVGGEFMAPDKVARLREIGTQTWQRHFDDRLGCSHDELERIGDTPPEALPATEHLLADKPQHIVPRGPSKALDPRYGFKVKVPTQLYHYGELHNLSVARGTLTEEERFKINEHIIQTIVMLEALPLPKHLRRVPEYAGTHHETMVGTGYPRQLTASELSIPARIMAIADIFEALTASDRPYKKAKTLSESMDILVRFRNDGHIDADLFALFLRSGVYRAYGERYLKPEQLDAVDIDKYLAPSLQA